MRFHIRKCKNHWLWEHYSADRQLVLEVSIVKYSDLAICLAAIQERAGMEVINVKIDSDC